MKYLKYRYSSFRQAFKNLFAPKIHWFIAIVDSAGYQSLDVNMRRLV